MSLQSPDSPTLIAKQVRPVPMPDLFSQEREDIFFPPPKTLTELLTMDLRTGLAVAGASQVQQFLNREGVISILTGALGVYALLGSVHRKTRDIDLVIASGQYEKALRLTMGLPYARQPVGYYGGKIRLKPLDETLLPPLLPNTDSNPWITLEVIKYIEKTGELIAPEGGWTSVKAAFRPISATVLGQLLYGPSLEFLYELKSSARKNTAKNVFPDQYDLHLLTNKYIGN